MTDKKATRLSKIAKEFNVGISTIVDFLQTKGHEVDSNPNTKISPVLHDILEKEYSKDITAKKESEKVKLNIRNKPQTITLDDVNESEKEVEEETASQDEILITDKSAGTAKEEIFNADRPKLDTKVKVIGKIDLDNSKKPKAEEKSQKPEKPKEQEKVVTPEPEEKAAPKEPVQEKPETLKPEKQKIAKPKEIVAEEKPKEKAPEPKEEKPVEKVEEKPKEEPLKAEKTEKPVEAKPEVDAKEKPEDSSPETEKNIETKVKQLSGPTVVGKIDLSSMNQLTRPPRKTKEQRQAERKGKNPQNDNKRDKKSDSKKPEHVRGTKPEVKGPKVVGKIDLKAGDKKPVASSSDSFDGDKKRKRKRINKDGKRVDSNNQDNKQQSRPGNQKQGSPQGRGNNKRRGKVQPKAEISEEDVQKQIKDTLARLTNKGKSKGSKHRRDKRDAVRQEQEQQIEQQQKEKSVIKVTEFVSVSELATMMEVQATDIIATCMGLGLFVSINQRLDAETMTMLAEEYGYKVEFVSVEVQEAIKEDVDNPEDLKSRSPIVTVMGHVDHGKTKLLDHIRKSNVIAGEAGGITQHIGAYNVKVDDEKHITFLDTPGHEAFTAMRARGAQVTDVAIIVVAADDGIMPQTIEAINHAAAAGVPMVFAINKIDKPTANPDKIKEKLATMNYLVEEWGGKYQSQDISAIKGTNVDQLLEKVLLEAELLELKANPTKKATGTVIESELDKGRGYVVTVLVEGGTLHEGDIMLAGQYFGHMKALFNERGKRIKEAGPAMPVRILGLNGAPQAGDKFNIMESDKEAKEIATKRSQLQREQGLRTQKHITLDEIGRRIAIGNFKELNLIVKGDVDGSVEALSDSLIKLSTEEIQVNIKHKAVGQISEADILLAAASDAILIGFQVRPSANARRLAEKEEIDVRLYSIIYDAIEDVKSAMEGMLSPTIKEEIVATVEVRETFKITKVGTIAGCMVKEGKINRNSNIRVIRDGIVAYTGKLGSLKRFKDDVKEVASGYECGLNIENYNDIKVGDIVEAFKEVEVAAKL
ncbi:translation initiation factor IF-2 [Bacteroidales bacterium]|nr:translation initiation factor IF-2 [Bacteroidales bacterium]